MGAGAPSSADHYSVLGVAPDATEAEVRDAFRALAKRCHPDRMGGSSRRAEAAIRALNAARHTLADPARRAAYDSARALFHLAGPFAGFDGTPLSRTAKPGEEEALFVDETACIGCGKCVHEAPSTIALDEKLGRARVHTQHGDEPEGLDAAVASCPVDCIHRVPQSELAVLEWVHRLQPRASTVICSEASRSGRLRGVEENPFVAVDRFKRKMAEISAARERGEEAAARAAHSAASAFGYRRRPAGEWRIVDGPRSRDAPPPGEAAATCPVPRRRAPGTLLLPESRTAEQRLLDGGYDLPPALLSLLDREADDADKRR